MDGVGTYTQKVARYAASCNYDDLPQQAVDIARQLVLDTIGAIILGSRPGYASVRILGDMAIEEAANGRSTVFGRDAKGSFQGALLANGTMGYAADAEGGGASRMHAAAVFVPTVLTVGEHLNSSGRDVVAALALAYDVGCRISDAADPGPEIAYPHSFHPSAVFGHFGAAAAAGHLFQLNEEQFVNALGLAGINATGMINWVSDPTEDSRPFVIGVAAQSGTRASMLAKKGMGGPILILDDAKFSIYDAYSMEMHLDRLLDGLGQHHRILDADGFKRYPCCGDIHSGLDGVLSLMSMHGLKASDIESITHRVKPGRVEIIDDNSLKSHNSQYILSVAAVTGKIDPDDILIDRRSDPAVSDLYSRALLLPEPALDEITDGAPAIVEIQTRKGDLLSKRVDYSKGRVQNPLSASELEEKFMRWSMTRMSEDQAREIVEVTGRLEQLEDVGELTRLLAI
ncbi:MAG: MmgE/PrpD family protein [Chloroflexi bacterium]|nr:MmgE/PrpD family protein [Chloroflexota bacterium]